MTNNPEHRKLSSGQFGDITGQSPSSESGESWDFDPASVEAMREDYAKSDPNYAASRSARRGSRGAGGAISRSGDVSAAGDVESAPRGSSDFGIQVDLAGTAKSIQQSGEVSASEGSAATAYDETSTGRGRTFPGVGMGGWDVESGSRSSPFQTVRPRSREEAQARQVGLMYLKIAGPTCNHPTCKAYRAKGMELLGAPVEHRRGSIKSGEAPPPSAERPVIPSKRVNKKVAPVMVRPESKGKEKLVASYGTGKTSDFGDFMPVKGKEHEVTAIDYEPLVSKTSPEWKQLAAQTVGESLFHPEDYLEHHHEPGEENFKLPWE